MTGLTTRQFAEEIGVSQKTVTDAEGDKRRVRPITVNAYAMRTGVPVEWLRNGETPTSPPGSEGWAHRDLNSEPAVSVLHLVRPAA